LIASAPSQSPFGQCLVAAMCVKGSQVPERDRDLVMVVSEGAFEDGECSF
jgi:hypothetical protein